MRALGRPHFARRPSRPSARPRGPGGAPAAPSAPREARRGSGVAPSAPRHPRSRDGGRRSSSSGRSSAFFHRHPALPPRAVPPAAPRAALGRAPRGEPRHRLHLGAPDALRHARRAPLAAPAGDRARATASALARRRARPAALVHLVATNVFWRAVDPRGRRRDVRRDVPRDARVRRRRAAGDLPGHRRRDLGHRRLPHATGRRSSRPRSSSASSSRPSSRR